MFRRIFTIGVALSLLLSPVFQAPVFANPPSGDLNLPLDTLSVTITVAPTQLVANPSSGMRRLGFFVQPIGGDIVIGGSAVTNSTGFTLYSGQQLWLDSSSGGNWYAVRAGAVDVPTRVLAVY